MLPRLLVGASLAQLVLMYLPSPAWRWWMLHLVAVELSLVAALTGVGALVAGRGQPLVQALALVGIVGGLLPALATAPLYLRERVPFSPWAWLTGGPSPDVPIERDVPLVSGVDADVYRAAGTGPHPWVVVVHGGSWRSGDKGEVPRVSRALGAAGYTVFDLRYPLAPAAPFPAAVDHVRCAIAQLQDHATEYGLDPDRGAILGRSARGQIALVAAYADATLPARCSPRPLAAVISLYAPTDLAWDHDNPFVPDVVDGTDALRKYLGGTPTQAPNAYRRGTPMTWLDHPVPATLLIHGTSERCVRPVNAERLRDALLAKGQTVEALMVPYADHGFDVRPGGIAEQLARGRILAFLKAHV